MMNTFSRYEKFTENGSMKLVPFIEIPIKSTDQYTYYIQGTSRMDLISYQYYGNPNYGWLIMQANPTLGSYEFSIPNNTLIRIPYPLADTIIQYKSDIDLYNRIYGIEG